MKHRPNEISLSKQPKQKNTKTELKGFTNLILKIHRAYMFSDANQNINMDAPTLADIFDPSFGNKAKEAFEDECAYDFLQIDQYLKDKTLIESAFNTISHKLLDTAVIIAKKHPQLLEALLDNDKIRNKMDIHEVKHGTRTNRRLSPFRLAYEQMNSNAPQAILLLFKKLPFDKIMSSSVTEQDKKAIMLILLITAPDHPGMMQSLLQQKKFIDHLQIIVEAPLTAFGTLFTMLCATGEGNEAVGRLLEFENIDSKINSIAKNNIRVTNFVIYSAIACARAGRVTGLEKILDNKINLGKLKTFLDNKGCLAIFQKLIHISSHNPDLTQKIHTYLKEQEADIDELNQTRNQYLLKMAIDDGDIDELKKIKAIFNKFPVICYAITVARKKASDINSQNYYDALQVIRTLIENGASLEQTENGLTPLFHAIQTDLLKGTALTVLLLESSPKPNINAQCSISPSPDSVRALCANFNIQDKEVIEYLTRKSSPYPESMTPLHFCLMLSKEMHSSGGMSPENYKAIVQTLLSHKPDLTLKDGNDNCIKQLLTDDSWSKAKKRKPSENLENQIPPILQQLLSIHEKTRSGIQEITNKDKAQFINAKDDLNKDFDVFFSAADALATPDYSLIHDSEVARLRQALPADLIGRIIGEAICPAYKSHFQLTKDTCRIVNSQQHAEHKKASDVKNQAEYEQTKERLYPQVNTHNALTKRGGMSRPR